MRMGSGKGTPPEQQRPRRSRRLEAALVPAQPEVGQHAGLHRRAVDRDPALQDHQRVLVVGAQRHLGARAPQHQLDPHVLGVAPRRRVQPAEAADEDGRLAPVELEPRQLGVMLEGRRAVAGRGRLGHPELDGVDLLGPGRVLLGVGDPVARGHEVQLPRPDELLGAQAVQVEQLAGHQPRHGLQAQVGMGPDAERPPGSARTGPT